VAGQQGAVSPGAGIGDIKVVAASFGRKPSARSNGIAKARGLALVGTIFIGKAKGILGNLGGFAGRHVGKLMRIEVNCEIDEEAN